MPLRPPSSSAFRALLRLAVPVIAVQVGLMLMGVADTVMVGHLSPVALAAVALGNVYYFGAHIFGLGVLMALDPVITHAVGAGDHADVARGLQRGILLALLLCLPTILMAWPAPTVLAWLGQPAEVVPLAGQYVRLCIPGTLGFLLFAVFRQTLQALHRVRAIVITVALANLLNIVLNWGLIYGHLGLPALGVAGSAWASTIARLVMGGLIVWLGWPLLRAHLVPRRPEALQLRPLLSLFLLGLPIGAQYQLEYGVFGLVGFLMGRMGTTAVAGHQIALNLASLTFMVPLGLSAAAAVLVGHAVGRRDQTATRQAASAALVVAIGFMGTTAATFLLLPGPLARLYTDDAAVLAIGSALIPLAGVFQVFDGIQVTSIGVLRGLGDTRTPMLTGLLGFWLLGLPLSLLLGFTYHLGPQGLWWGLVFGLVVVAVTLLWRLRVKLAEPLKPVRLDAAIPIPES
jgi:MATE family multidrug resistance protein